MAFSRKTWKKRLSEYPTRRQLTYTDGSTEIVDVARLEGTISQEGDAFSDTNMNDLEQRVADAFEECFQSVSDGKALVASAITDKGVTTASDATFETMANNIESIPTGSKYAGVLAVGGFSNATVVGSNLAHFYDENYLEARSDNQFNVLKAGKYRASMYSQNSVAYLSVNGTRTTTNFGQDVVEVDLKVGDVVYFYRNITTNFYFCGYMMYVTE